MNSLRSLLAVFDPSWLVARLTRYSPLPIRFIVGYGFMAHGYAKLVKHPENFAAILHALGVPAPHLMAWATIVVELLGGFAILVGAFVPLVAVPMIVVLLVATFTVHLQYGFTSIKLMSVVNGVPRFGPPGYETDALYVAGLIALLFSGSGPFAIDAILKPLYARVAPGSRAFNCSHRSYRRRRDASKTSARSLGFAVRG
jgi:putative oxidoreductase